LTSDYSETWILLKKKLATYDAAAMLNQWSICADVAEEMRTLSTDLLLWAIKRQKERDVNPG